MQKEADKEMERVKFALNELKIISPEAKSPIALAKSYFVDAQHFYSRKDYEKSIRLLYYIFGILDALATLKMIDPGAAKKHYKVEQ